MSDSQYIAKLNAARAGAAFIETDMIVGLGSGSTAELLVQEIGRRLVEEKLKLTAVSTSEKTSQLATSVGIQVLDPESVERLDLILDGADEIDPRFRMIKGRGGALLREKIVAAAAKQRVILVDPSKPVEKLGQRHSLPVEIADFGRRWTLIRLESIAKTVRIRCNPDGSLFRTDGGNRIVDLETGPIEDPESLQSRILEIPGVYESGLFIGLCDVLVIGNESGADVRERAT